jgi:hypothetical protein
LDLYGKAGRTLVHRRLLSNQKVRELNELTRIIEKTPFKFAKIRGQFPLSKRTWTLVRLDRFFGSFSQKQPGFGKSPGASLFTKSGLIPRQTFGSRLPRGGSLIAHYSSLVWT